MDCGIEMLFIVLQIQGVEGAHNEVGVSVPSSTGHNGASDIIPSC